MYDYIITIYRHMRKRMLLKIIFNRYRNMFNDELSLLINRENE